MNNIINKNLILYFIFLYFNINKFLIDYLIFLIIIILINKFNYLSNKKFKKTYIFIFKY